MAVKGEMHMTGEHFDKRGIRKLNPAEEKLFSRSYEDEMVKGLQGRESSIKMYPSLLPPVELGDLPSNKEALIVEIGGTHLYSARVSLVDGTPTVKDSHKARLPGTVYGSAEDFFAAIAHATPTSQDAQPDALGIVYSFPGKPLRTSFGVDVMSPEALTKGFQVPGIDKKPVGEAFKEALHKKMGLDRNLPTAVLNDTVAVAFAGGAKIGGVVATGFNLAATVDDNVINTESGAFKAPIINDSTKVIDEESMHPGHSLAEKQISGLYLGKQLEYIAKELGIPLPGNVTAETVSVLLSGEIEDPAMEPLREAADRLRARSAQLVGLMIGSIINTFPHEFAGKHVRIPIEGSLFWGMPGYESLTSAKAVEMSGKQIEFLNIADAGRVGAGVAALSQIVRR